MNEKDLFETDSYRENVPVRQDGAVLSVNVRTGQQGDGGMSTAFDVSLGDASASAVTTSFVPSACTLGQMRQLRDFGEPAAPPRLN